MWHSTKKKQVLKELETSLDGLQEKEASKRAQEHGANQIVEKKRTTSLHMFLRQFTDFLIILLIIAGAISFFIGETLDGIAIIAIVVINGIFGFFQEYKAEKAIEALKKLSTPSCKVIREGKEKIISSNNLVPGDIIVVEGGDRVPADAYLLESMSLQADESMLTGESTPVKKRTGVLPKKTLVPERNNMLFSGTVITYGRAKAVVVETGMETEFGKIADMVQVSEEKTPLQRRMNSIGKFLGAITLAICLLVFVIGLIEKTDPFRSFGLAVSLAVSAVPEGLPATMTLSLAIGVQRLVKKNTLTRKLSSLETLGGINYICTDKTGTITKNEMTIKKVFLNNMMLDVTGTGYSPAGEFFSEKKVVDPHEDPHLELLIKTGRLCNDSHLIEQNKKWSIVGDPTEGALLVLAAKAGMAKQEKYYPRIKERFFDSERKRMSTLHKSTENKKYVFAKGAPESLMEVSNRVMVDGKIKKMTPGMKKKILEMNDAMASDALRVLGLAYKEYKEGPLEKELVFLGLVGMIDPPRDEVKDALELCGQAGINVMMITGDHKITAVAIAKQVGLYNKNGLVLTEEEISQLSDEELDYKIEQVTVCARISPASKSRIVNSLKRKGHSVAVTGDGINDAPALKKADIGVAVGSGTDVTKQASDMIIVDDNFATIVNAVGEGRTIFDNIKKFVRFLLSANFIAIFLVITSFLLKTPIPFIPLQILWLNILTDGLPAVALGAEPKDPKVMHSKPRNPKENILRSIMVYSAFVAVIGYLAGMFVYLNMLNIEVGYMRTMIFTFSVFFELFLVFSVRTDSFFWRAPKNKYLYLSILLSVFLQILALYVYPFTAFLETVPLNLSDWAAILGLCLASFFSLEFIKAVQQKLIKSNI